MTNSDGITIIFRKRNQKIKLLNRKRTWSPIRYLSQGTPSIPIKGKSVTNNRSNKKYVMTRSKRLTPTVKTIHEITRNGAGNLIKKN